MFKKLTFMMQNNGLLLFKWFPAYGMQELAADTKTWAAGPTRAVLRYILRLLAVTFACRQTRYYINRLPNNSKQNNVKISVFFGRPFAIEI